MLITNKEQQDTLKPQPESCEPVDKMIWLDLATENKQLKDELESLQRQHFLLAEALMNLIKPRIDAMVEQPRGAFNALFLQLEERIDELENRVDDLPSEENIEDLVTDHLRDLFDGDRVKVIFD
jgi:molecular chaperone GrpE (heat shock protein)